MKYPIFLIGILLFAGHAFSQSPDSLLTVKTVDSLVNSSTELQKAKKLQEALTTAQQAVDISRLNWGEHNAWYATALHRLAGAYNGLKQLDKAEDLYLTVLQVRSEVIGKESADYAQSLFNLAKLYDEKGLSVKSEPLYKESKDIRAVVLGKDHPDYAQSVNNLAICYWRKGDYANAETYYLESADIRARVLGKAHPDYSASLNNLAILYYDKGDYDKAERMYLESAAIWKKATGNDDPAPLNGLAILYKNKGDYAKAEPLFLKAIEIRAATVGKEHKDYAASLNNLAALYRIKGDYTKAEPLYLESKDIRAKVLGKEHPLYAQSLNNLANLYYVESRFAEAESLYLESKEIRAKSLGKDHPDYAQSLSNLGSMYRDKGDYRQAESMFLESAAIWEKVTGKEHPEYAKLLNNLASLSISEGDYTRAEPWQLEANAIWAKILGTDNLEYAGFINNLAILYQAANRMEEAEAVFLQLNDLNRHVIEQSATYSSESQMLAFLQTLDIPTAQFLSFTRSHPSPALTRTAFDNALFSNGLLLENARLLARSVAAADSASRELYERWQGCHRRLAKEYAKPIAERKYVTEVETEAEGYEKSLTRNMPAFGAIRHVPHWREVQQALKPGDVAIEFIHYRYSKPKPTDTVLYAALVLRPGDAQPQFVPLFAENELTPRLRGATGGSNFLKINALYDNKNGGNGQKSLYELIWRPLDSLLATSESTGNPPTIYGAPSGLLHRINLAAIQQADGQPFGNIHQLVVLGSTRQLIDPDLHDSAYKDAAYLAGGIRYDTDKASNALANRNASTRGTEMPILIFQPDSASVTRGGVLEYLPATAAEVHDISQVLTTAGVRAKVDTGFYATEESFKTLGVGVPSPRIIHLATHGYFFSDPKTADGRRQPADGSAAVFKLSEHPMIRSGLIMAGAKETWLTGKHPAGQEDGILTAYEISQLNLSGTELVVLSACETGLGDIVGNEGVYGLQRAFKIAGAKYLIMSLWKVDDRRTQEFMTTFYRHWLTGKLPIPQAFRQAQREMRTKYSGPYDWAGFELIE